MNKIFGKFWFSLIVTVSSYLECDEGKFGQHCNQSCGHCLNKEQCHNINGTCLNGCDSGYYGSECTEGNCCKAKLEFNFNLQGKMLKINKEYNLHAN